jgi:hypothetical protein
MSEVIGVQDILSGIVTLAVGYIIWTLKASTTRWDAKEDKEHAEKNYGELKDLIRENAQQDSELRKIVTEVVKKVDIFITQHDTTKKHDDAVFTRIIAKLDSLDDIARKLDNHEFRIKTLEKKCGVE